MSTFFIMGALTFLAKSTRLAFVFIGSYTIFAHEIDQAYYIDVVHHFSTHIFPQSLYFARDFIG